MSLRKTTSVIIGLTFLGVMVLMVFTLRNTLQSYLLDEDTRQAEVELARAVGALAGEVRQVAALVEAGGQGLEAIPSNAIVGVDSSNRSEAGWLVYDSEIWLVGKTADGALAHRWRDEDESRQLSQLKLVIHLQPISDASLSDSDRYALAVLQNGQPTYFSSQNAFTTTGYALIQDIKGESSILMTLQISRVSYQKGQLLSNYLLIIMVAGGSIFAIMTWLLISSLVLSPLLRLNREVAAITTSADASQRLSLSSRRDELEQLSRNINGMLTALEKAQAQVREDENRLAQLTGEVQEAERRHLAQELHDEIGQALTGLRLMLVRAEELPVIQQKTQLKQAQSLLNDLVEQVRQLSLNLRPTMLDDLGLLPALLWHVERFQSQTGITVDFTHAGLESLQFPQDIETAAYRLVQEALTNVARHACVQQVSLSVWCRDNKLTIQVEDEGNGFDVPSALSRGSTRGLPGMRQRVQFLKGKLTIDSAIGEGTRLLAEIPVPPTGVSP